MGSVVEGAGAVGDGFELRDTVRQGFGGAAWGEGLVGGGGEGGGKGGQGRGRD